jgi:hypothetical protein
VHLEVRVAAQPIHWDERRPVTRSEPFFGAAVAPDFPRRANQLGQMIG